MDEFNNRVEAQRHVLRVVNQQAAYAEELFGLSRKAIDRWLHINGLDPNGETARILIQISSRLFFLSNSSQEHVTEEYQLLSEEVHKLTKRLEQMMCAHAADTQ